MSNHRAGLTGGGLAAGAIRMLGNGEPMVVALGLTSYLGPLPEASPLLPLVASGIQVLLGFLTVFLYAHLRGRLGPGHRSSVGSGVLSWVAGSLIWSLGPMGGLFSWSVLVVRMAMALVVAVLAAMVAGRVYEACVTPSHVPDKSRSAGGLLR